MDKRQTMKIMDGWANFYLWLFADADHMMYVDNGRYCMAYPKPGEKGINSVFNIRLEGLAEDELGKTIAEIKALQRHTWWDQYSERITRLVFPEGRPEITPDDYEVYAIMTPEEKPTCPAFSVDVRRISSQEDFAIWCGMENANEFHGSEDLHPSNHYHHCLKGTVRCYVTYDSQGQPVSVAGMMDNRKGIFSLEFVSTAPEYRNRGFATATCARALEDAFQSGAEMVTVRAYGDAGKKLGRALGFTYIG